MKKYKKRAASILSAILAFVMIAASGMGYLGETVAYAEGEISISTAADLQKIGIDQAYPLSGDYVLTADIDMTGIEFTPIGGGSGTRGSASGNNVFTGTFDGNGHIISNLSIHKTGNSSGDWQYGMFGIIGSSSDNDKASVKNLILTGLDINVDMSGNGYLSLGGLAGEINHNAEIDNVAIIDGTISGNPSNGGDVVGVGGLAGEMRYESQSWGGWGGQTSGNNGVVISNIYVGADVISGGSKDSNYAGGIIGRIAKTSPASMTACVFTGNAEFKGNSGYGISGGDMTGNISNCYYLSDSGIANTGSAVSQNQLKAGTLLQGLSASYWTASEGTYMQLKQCAESETIAGILAMSGLSLKLAEGDTLSAVTGNFTVPMSITTGDTTEAVTWSCDPPQVLSIGDDGTVTVGEVYTDTECILTATTASGMTKNFKITVLGKVSMKIDQEYATVGEPLTVSMVDAPEDMQCTYEWYVGGTKKGTGASYTPTSADLEKKLTVTATAAGDYAGTYQASMYISKLPVMYVNTEGGQAITSKEDYINGDFKIQGNAQYNTGNTTLYDGAIEIRGRGNTTWGYAKKPYKIKLGTKTDLFGFGKNKHWVLLANYTDESHMRNTLAYNLSGEIGMPYMQSVHVDLVLNGEYVGTYQFCEQVKIAGGRVDIHDWEDYAGDVAKAVYTAEKDNGLVKKDQDGIEDLLKEEDMSWLTTGKFTYKNTEYTIKDYISDMPDFTGGFLIELDSYYDEYSKFKSSKQQPLQFKSPEFIATNPQAMSYVENYINAFESAVNASDFTAVYNNETVSYSQLFDMDSLVQYWMIYELFMNVDAMKKSTYMYKDIDGLFHMGPVWDMDWSSNSLVSQYQGSGTYNEWQTIKFSDAVQANQWYKTIIQDPYFAVKAYELYTQMREKMGEIVTQGGILDTYQALLTESADANANIWYQRENNKKFDTQTTVLKTYLANRLNWMDTQFTSPETLAASLGYKTAGGITVKAEQNGSKETAAVVLTAEVTDSNVKSVEFMVNGRKIGTAAVADGKAVMEAPQSALVSSGSYNTVQVFGLNTNGNVIVSRNNKVTDYAKFYADKAPDPIDPIEPTDPTVTAVAVTPKTASVKQGEEQIFTATVTGENNPSTEVTWSVSGAASEDTKITQEGKLTVGSNETAATLTVTATSKADGTKSDTATVTVVKSSGSDPVNIAKPSLNVKKITLGAKESFTLKVKKAPAGKIKYSSNKPKIASVDKKGKITAKKKGSAVITVTMSNGKKLTCKVTVKNAPKKISLGKKSITLKKGKKYQIKVKLPKKTASYKITYKSNKKSVASVDAKGKIKARKKGNATITVTTFNKKKATLKVKVK